MKHFDEEGNLTMIDGELDKVAIANKEAYELLKKQRDHYEAILLDKAHQQSDLIAKIKKLNQDKDELQTTINALLEARKAYEKLLDTYTGAKEELEIKLMNKAYDKGVDACIKELKKRIQYPELRERLTSKLQQLKKAEV